MAVAHRPTVWGRALSAIGGIVVGALVVVAANAAVAAAAPPAPGWVWAEINLWVTALILLAVNLVLLPRRSQAEGRPAEMASAS